MKRPSGIVIVFALTCVVVLGSGMAGYIEAGLGEGEHWISTAKGLLAPWLTAAVLSAAIVTMHAYSCHAVFIEYLDCDLSNKRLVVGMLALLLVHAAEIQIFGLGIYSYAMLTGEQLGGQSQERLIDYLYFSYATYTSLGLGDIYPEESIRLIVGIEALTGLLMIGWSASMTVVLFRREWFS